MGLSEDVKKLQAKLKELKEELKGFGDDINIKAFNDASEDASELNTQIKAAQSLLEDLKPDLDYVYKSFADSVAELQKSNYYLNLQKNSLRGLSSQARTISEIKQGDLNTDEKSIKKQQIKYKQYVDNLELSKRREGITDSEIKQINKQIQDAKEVEKGFKTVLERHKEINNELGLAPQLAGGLDKALQKIGFPSLGISDMVEETQRLGQKAKENGDKFNALSTFVGKLGTGLKGAITKANLLSIAITGLVNGFMESQKGIGDLAKGLGMSAERATFMRQEFADIANLSMDANVNVKNLQEAQMAVGAALGTNAMLNEHDLITMAEIVKKTGLQYNELVKIEKLSLATGKSLEENVEAALGGATAYASQNKLLVDNNKVLREVNNASSSLKLSLGGSVEALGEAVVKVQQLGMDLKTAEQIASSMLNFESSIEAELEAELLTGKNLNMERARQLALEGDIAGAAKEMADQLGSAEEFGKMNVIQQEALAKSIGLNRDALADSLIEREALAKMSMVEGETALERYNLLKAQGKSQAEIVELLGEEAAGQLEQQSAQDKFNASVEKLKEIFTQVMDALAPIFDVLSNIATVIMPALNLILQPLVTAFQGIGKIITGSYEELEGWEAILGSIALVAIGYYSTMKLIKGVQIAIRAQKIATIAAQRQGLAVEAASGAKAKVNAVAGIVSGAWKSLGPIPFIGAALAVGAIASGIAYLFSQSSKAGKADDMMSSPGYGKRTLFGPEGAIQLNNKDTVIAGTNLFGNDVKSEPGKTTEMAGEGEMKITSSPKVDMSQTNALLQQLIAAVTTGGVVTLDGQKVGEALKIGSFQTQ